MTKHMYCTHTQSKRQNCSGHNISLRNIYSDTLIQCFWRDHTKKEINHGQQKLQEKQQLCQEPKNTKNKSFTFCMTYKNNYKEVITNLILFIHILNKSYVKSYVNACVQVTSPFPNKSVTDKCLVGTLCFRKLITCSRSQLSTSFSSLLLPPPSQSSHNSSMLEIPHVASCLQMHKTYVDTFLSAPLYVILMTVTTIVQLVDSTQFSVPHDWYVLRVSSEVVQQHISIWYNNGVSCSCGWHHTLYDLLATTDGRK